MDITTAFIPLTQAFELMKPGKTTFDNPASFTQAASVDSVTFGQQRDYSQFPQCSTKRFTMVGSIPLKTIRSLFRTTRLTADCRNGVYQRQRLRHVMPVCPGEFMGKGDAICISNQMVLGARFTPICRVRAALLPPKTALTEAESTTALEKSIRSHWRSWTRRIWCILSQTPAFCQSRKRRQHVIPLPQPISFGKYSQPMPVLSTNRIPIRASLSETGFRPGYLNLLFFFGMIGSMIFHNLSSSIGFAMSNLLVVELWLLMLSVVAVSFLSFF
jgi:hypothetical protein